MIGADTNCVVRLLVADDAAQTRRVRRVFSTEAVFIAKSVLLETEWVLRSAYGISSEKIATAFRKLANVERIHLEDSEGVEKALGLYERGFDFADALHLVSSRKVTERFVTFDKRFRKAASSVKGLPKVVLP